LGELLLPGRRRWQFLLNMADATTSIAKVKDINEVRRDMAGITTGYDPNVLLKQYQDKANLKGLGEPSDGKDDLFKLMTLNEFENGALLTISVEEIYKTFGIELMRNLKREYICKTTSEQATAELAAISYIRTMDIQRKINSYLGRGEITDMGVRYLAVMSKELDRANRHYLTAPQTLRLFKQTMPPNDLGDFYQVSKNCRKLSIDDLVRQANSQLKRNLLTGQIEEKDYGLRVQFVEEE